MGQCLEKDVSEIIHIYYECHIDVMCWIEKVGVEALKCGGKCWKDEDNTEQLGKFERL